MYTLSTLIKVYCTKVNLVKLIEPSFSCYTFSCYNLISHNYFNQFFYFLNKLVFKNEVIIY